MCLDVVYLRNEHRRNVRLELDSPGVERWSPRRSSSEEDEGQNDRSGLALSGGGRGEERFIWGVPPRGNSSWGGLEKGEVLRNVILLFRVEKARPG